MTETTLRNSMTHPPFRLSIYQSKIAGGLQGKITTFVLFSEMGKAGPEGRKRLGGFVH